MGRRACKALLHDFDATTHDFCVSCAFLVARPLYSAAAMQATTMATPTRVHCSSPKNTVRNTYDTAAVRQHICYVGSDDVRDMVCTSAAHRVESTTQNDRIERGKGNTILWPTRTRLAGTHKLRTAALLTAKPQLKWLDRQQQSANKAVAAVLTPGQCSGCCRMGCQRHLQPQPRRHQHLRHHRWRRHHSKQLDVAHAAADV